MQNTKLHAHIKLQVQANYNLAYFNGYVLRQQTGKQIMLHRTVASIARLILGKVTQLMPFTETRSLLCDPYEIYKSTLRAEC
jgi:hypothetical protein